MCMLAMNIDRQQKGMVWMLICVSSSRKNLVWRMFVGSGSVAVAGYCRVCVFSSVMGCTRDQSASEVTSVSG